MKLSDILASRDQATISFEFFPARSEKAAGTLEKVIDKLARLKPDFVSVTFGAGGTTRGGSYQLAEKLRVEKELEVMPYFAGIGLGPHDMTSILDDYRGLGIENLLVVRGDEPRDVEDFQPHPESLPHATDMLAFVAPRYDFCLGAAGYPEGHIAAPSLTQDIQYLKVKVEQGAEFIIANYFWDNRYYFTFLEQCAQAGIEVPIIAGVMPVYNVKMMEMLAGLCGATITPELRAGIDALPPDDKQALASFGIEFATRQCRELLERGVRGLHFYTMDRSKSVTAIVEQLRSEGLLPAP